MNLMNIVLHILMKEKLSEDENSGDKELSTENEITKKTT